MYVGHSINLYNRISSYFMPSILKTKARKVLRYLNKYGFNNLRLTVLIMDPAADLEKIVALEQYFLDSLKPNLNVDFIASSSGYHEPMPIELREKLRKLRGTPVYVYRATDLVLLFVFESKQHIYDIIKIHHNTLQDCLDSGSLYLDTFFLCIEKIEEATDINLLTKDQLILLVNEKRERHRTNHPAAKAIIAEFKDDLAKNLEFNSLNSLAKHLKGDRQVIREYLKKSKLGYYRGKWKFNYKTGEQSSSGEIFNK